MRNQRILLLGAAVLLSGCAMPQWPTQPSGQSLGKTYEQLVTAKRSDQQVDTGVFVSPFYCHSCDGQPTRTYTNPAGNKVAAYFYSFGADSSHPPYSMCLALEERYELRDGIVVDEWYAIGDGPRLPLYTPNPCAGYDRIDVGDPPLAPHVPPVSEIGRPSLGQGR